MMVEILYEVCSKRATSVSTYHFQKWGGGEKEARAQGLKGSASFMTRSATTTKRRTHSGSVDLLVKGVGGI